MYYKKIRMYIGVKKTYNIILYGIDIHSQVIPHFFFVLSDNTLMPILI
jgi:hypothetical protein